MAPATVFARCVQAIADGALIRRESVADKEYHFQNWFRARLQETNFHFEVGGRNSYPDFRLVASTEGFELKGLAYPGRDASFDSNSQVPTGFHNGRTIYYVFGRYPKKPDGDTYPVLDLVVCHGDFLNADHEYSHKNKSVNGFGSYGDILIRDRKMYVVPTPFHLVEGVAHRQTLILPAEVTPGGFLRGRRAVPPGSGRADCRLLLQPRNERPGPEDGTQPERGHGTSLPRLAGNRLGGRSRLHAQRPGRASRRRTRE